MVLSAIAVNVDTLALTPEGERMSTSSTSPVIAFAAALCSASAAAAEPSPLVYGYVQLMSNYIGRGLSQSVGQPSVQAEIDVNAGNGPYLNLGAVRIAWIDKLAPRTHADVEIDGVLGWRQLFGESGEFRVGVLRMQFPGRYAAGVARPDTTEVFALIAAYAASARLNVDVTDSFGTPGTRGSWYLDTNITHALGEAWRVSAHAGRRQLRGHDPLTGEAYSRRSSYTDFKLGLTRMLGRHSSVTAAWSWTTAKAAYYTLDGYDVSAAQGSFVYEYDF